MSSSGTNLVTYKHDDDGQFSLYTSTISHHPELILSPKYCESALNPYQDLSCLYHIWEWIT